MEVLLALSKEALKIIGILKMACSRTNSAAISYNKFLDSMTHGPAIIKGALVNF